MSYLAFLSFIVATGLYWLMGPGGPLHSIDFLSFFRSQISEEEEGSSTRAALILVVAPSVLFALLYVLVESAFGAAAMLLLGTAALFFSFGREDFPTLLEHENNNTHVYSMSETTVSMATYLNTHCIMLFLFNKRNEFTYLY